MTSWVRPWRPIRVIRRQGIHAICQGARRYPGGCRALGGGRRILSRHRRSDTLPSTCCRCGPRCHWPGADRRRLDRAGCVPVSEHRGARPPPRECALGLPRGHGTGTPIGSGAAPDTAAPGATRNSTHRAGETRYSLRDRCQRAWQLGVRCPTGVATREAERGSGQPAKIPGPCQSGPARGRARLSRWCERKACLCRHRRAYRARDSHRRSTPDFRRRQHWGSAGY